MGAGVTFTKTVAENLTLGTGTQIIGPVSIRQASRLSVQIVYGAALVTSAQVFETSNHPRAMDASPPAEVKWTDESADVTIAAAAASATQQTIHLDNVNAAWFRLNLTVGTGGDISVYVHAKE